MLSKPDNGQQPREHADAWAALRLGDRAALGRLYDYFIDDLFCIGMSTLGDRNTVQDQIHDLFLDLYKYHSKLAVNTCVKAYLITSFRRRLYKRDKSVTLIEDMGTLGHSGQIDTLRHPSAEDVWIDAEMSFGRVNRLQSSMQTLTPHQQEVLHLRFAQDKSYDEIADQMEVSVASARTLIYRTLKALRSQLASLIL